MKPVCLDQISYLKEKDSVEQSYHVQETLEIEAHDHISVQQATPARNHPELILTEFTV